MTKVRRSDKALKRDQHVVRDTLQEIEEEVESGRTKPQLQNPNRDRALGDWDRTGDHHDEETGK